MRVFVVSGHATVMYMALKAVVLASFLLLGAQASNSAKKETLSEDQLRPPSEGIGIYRPYSALRQLRLLASYLADPPLPGRVQVYYAYALEELAEEDLQTVMSGVKAGTVRLSVRISGSREDENENLTILDCPDSPQACDGGTLQAWLQRLRASACGVEGLYALSPEAVGKSRARPFISWDPKEAVKDISASDVPSLARR